jgi:hypothetical protein
MKRELDIQALYAAVESKKSEFALTWRGLATELELGDHTVFTRMAKGQIPEPNTLLTLTGWLGLPLEDFARGDVVAPDSRRHTLEAINSFLRADKALAPESAGAIYSVMRAAYDQLADETEGESMRAPQRAAEIESDHGIAAGSAGAG